MTKSTLRTTSAATNYRQLIRDPKVALALSNALLYALMYVPVALGLAMP